MIKIFKGIIWNSLLIMFLCENNFHARFISFIFQMSVFICQKVILTPKVQVRNVG